MHNEKVVANLITAPESVAAAAPFRAWPSSRLIATVETDHHRKAIIAKRYLHASASGVFVQNNDLFLACGGFYLCDMVYYKNWIKLTTY